MKIEMEDGDIPFAPVPTQIQVTLATVTGTNQAGEEEVQTNVLLWFQHQAGLGVFGIDVEAAHSLAKALQKAARDAEMNAKSARSGLTVVGKDQAEQVLRNAEKVVQEQDALKNGQRPRTTG